MGTNKFLAVAALAFFASMSCSTANASPVRVVKFLICRPSLVAETKGIFRRAEIGNARRMLRASDSESSLIKAPTFNVSMTRARTLK
jgi:hypothetical protein